MFVGWFITWYKTINSIDYKTSICACRMVHNMVYVDYRTYIYARKIVYDMVWIYGIDYR